MAARFGPDTGDSLTFPVRVSAHPPNNRTTRGKLTDLALLACPRVYADEFEDFNGRLQVHDYYVPLVGAAGANAVTTTGNTIGEIRIPQGGQILAVDLVSQTALAIDGTNYVRVTATNVLGAGAGSTTVAPSATTVNTTFTAGTAITADVPYALTLTATAADLYVTAGDVVRVQVAVTGTLGGALIGPVARIRVQTLPDAWQARMVRTGKGPFVGVQANVANGILQAVLAATSEAQTAGFDWGDQLVIPATKGPLFEAYLQIPTAITTAQTFVAGLGTAFNATVTSMAEYCRFRLAASMALVVDIYDGTTAQNAVSTGVTLSAGTYYLFRIDMTVLGKIRFWVDENMVYEGSASAFAVTHLFQPTVWIQKTTGVTTPSYLLDWVRCMWART